MLRRLTTVCCLVVSFLGLKSVNADWNYNQQGPTSWSKTFPRCAGFNQSPINIRSDEAIESIGGVLGQFQRSMFDKKLECVEISNTGTTVYAKVHDVSGGINDRSLLPGLFKLHQFHMHWGPFAGGIGSEHSIDGNKYFGEIHFVYFNKKYKRFEDAVDKSDGLAVLGFFIEPNYPQENLAIERLFKWFPMIANKGETFTIPSHDLFALETLLPNDLSSYYRYNGSLTTPPCFESVTWTVFKDPIRISELQANRLATSLFHNKKALKRFSIARNFRPIQKNNGRIIYVSLPCGHTQQPAHSMTGLFTGEEKGFHVTNQDKLPPFYNP